MALANKNARILWAVLTRGETFDPEHVPLTPHERAARQAVPMAASRYTPPNNGIPSPLDVRSKMLSTGQTGSR